MSVLSPQQFGDNPFQALGSMVSHPIMSMGDMLKNPLSGIGSLVGGAPGPGTPTAGNGLSGASKPTTSLGGAVSGMLGKIF
jgi:hypothetical protein